MLELVSPACSPEAVIAAVQSGADAIYITFGGGSDGAFTQEDFAKAVRYARVRDCRVYLELGRLFGDDELRAASKLVMTGAELGVNAVVTQDIGLVSVVRSVAPDMDIHGGERLGFYNLAGVEAAARLGMKRVRLSPQTTAREMAAISANCSVELEAEIFGATCFSRPGLCYFGAMADGRSANMGGCSRLCRGRFSMGGRMDDRPMSLKDINLLPLLGELSAAGVAAVRIGRSAARPEAAALITDVVYNCIRSDRAPSPAESERIDIAFSHREFTDEYFKGTAEDVFGADPENDRDAEKIFSETRRRYAQSELRRVPVGFHAVIMRSSAARLTAQDQEGHRVTVYGPRAESASVRALTEKDVESELYKTGGTPYLCAGVRAMVDDGVFLGSEELAELRRAALKKLSEQRSSLKTTRVGSFPALPLGHGVPESPKMIFQVLTAEQLTPELAELKSDYIYVPLDVICAEPGALAPFTEAGTTPVAVLPAVITDPEAAEVYELLQRGKIYGVTQALCAGLGHAALARKAGYEVRADHGLNLHNSFALELAARSGFLSATASLELTVEQIKELSKTIDTEMIVYGRVPVMISDRCAIKRSAGRCACSAPLMMSNGTGAVYPVVKDYGCRNKVLAGAKLFMADRWADCADAGLWGARLAFTTESARECAQVARRYMGLTDYRPNGLTRGLYYKGV